MTAGLMVHDPPALIPVTLFSVVVTPAAGFVKLIVKELVVVDKTSKG